MGVMGKKKRSRAVVWTKGFTYLFIYELFTQFAFFMVQPVVAAYAVSIGAAFAFAGVVVGSNSLAAMFSRPLAGMLSDRVDPCVLIRTSSALFCLACIGCTFAPYAGFLVAFRILQGMAFAAKTTLVVAIVVHMVPSESLGEGVAAISLAYIIAIAIAPCMGNALSNLLGYRFAYGASSILMMMATAMAFWIKVPASMQREKKNQGGLWREGSECGVSDFICIPVFPITLVSFCLSFVVGSVVSFVILAGEERGVGYAAVYFVAFAVVTLFIRPLAGRISDTKGAPVVVFPSITCVCIAALLLTGMDSASSVALAGVFMAFGYGAGGPVLQAECVKRAQDGKVGVATSTYFMGPDGGNCAGPMVCGALVQSVGYSTTFALCACVALFGAVVYALFLNLSR